MKHKIIFGVAVAAVLVVLAVGVSALAGRVGDHTHMADSAAATTTNQVYMRNYMFTPSTIRVRVGTTVTWMNADSVNHTVTADMNSTDAPNSMDIAHSKSYSFTFKKAGTFTYHCFPHPYMHGTVEVTNS